MSFRRKISGPGAYFFCAEDFFVFAVHHPEPADDKNRAEYKRSREIER